MSYPLRYPLSWVVARSGVTISINIKFIYDDDVKVFIAISDDIKGLVLEAENFNDLKKEVEEAVPVLLELACKRPLQKASTDVIFTDHLAAA